MLIVCAVEHAEVVCAGDKLCRIYWACASHEKSTVPTTTKLPPTHCQQQRQRFGIPGTQTVVIILAQAPRARLTGKKGAAAFNILCWSTAIRCAPRSYLILDQEWLLLHIWLLFRPICEFCVVWRVLDPVVATSALGKHFAKVPKLKNNSNKTRVGCFYKLEKTLTETHQELLKLRPPVGRNVQTLKQQLCEVGFELLVGHSTTNSKWMSLPSVWKSRPTEGPVFRLWGMSL